MAINREKILDGQINKAYAVVREIMLKQLELKSNGTFKSTHEILGVVTEEYYELIEAVKSGDIEHIRQELADVAVSAIFGIACIENKSVDW